jgi:hypothetical protein
MGHNRPHAVGFPIRWISYPPLLMSRKACSMSQPQVDATALLCRLLERDKPEINGQALVTDHADAATHLLRERLLVLGRTLDWVTCPECGIETARVVRELSPDRIALRCPDCAEAQAPRRLQETHKVALQRVIAALLNGLGLSANGLKPIEHELTWRLGTTEPTRGKALAWYFVRRLTRADVAARLNTVEFPGEAMMLRSQDGGVTVAIPIRIQRYSGRRQVVAPQGISVALPGQRAPTALQVALARGHRWLRQIEGGQARNLAEIADREKIDRSYVSRMVNLTTLAPDIQAAIPDEILPEEVVLFDLAIDTPLCWQAQCQRVTNVVAKVRAGKTQPAAQT